MNLTPHFSLAELTASDTAVARKIDNTPTPAITANLMRLAGVLERVRDLAGAPIKVSSGYRAPALNKAIGGSATSAHVFGLAADISTSAMSPKVLASLIRDSKIPFDQLIYEGTWVHIGLSAGKPRRQVLTAKFGPGGTTYVNGIV